MMRGRTGDKDLIDMMEKFQTRKGTHSNRLIERDVGLPSCLRLRSLERGLHPYLFSLGQESLALMDRDYGAFRKILSSSLKVCTGRGRSSCSNRE